MGKFNKGERHVQKEERIEKRPIAASSGSNKKKLYASLIFIFSFFLYSNTITHDYALDDDVVFKENRYVQQGFEGIKDIFSHGFLYGFNQRNNQSYRPLVSTVFAIEYAFFGANPLAGHLINVFFYALSCMLLFLMLTKMFRGHGLIVPFLIALIYAAHPIHTEVVANIKGRDDMLTLLLMVVTFYFLFDYLVKQKRMYLAFSVIAYFGCLLTKENAVAIIALIPITIFVFSESNIKGAMRSSLPFGMVLILYLLLRDSVLDTVGFGEQLDIINNSLMAAKTKSEMLATNFVILGKYLALLAVPHPLSFDYSFNHFPIVGWSNWQALLSLGIYVALGVYAVKNIMKKDIIAYGILLYLITFSVTSNLFVKIGATLGERFMFIPSLGFAIVFVLIIIRLLDRNKPEGEEAFYLSMNAKSKTLIGIVVVMALTYSVKTYSRNFDWENNQTLFRADINATPNSARTHFSLGSTLNTNSETEQDPNKKAEMLQEAITELRRTVEIHPTFSAAWYNMGVAYFNSKDEANAMIAYQNCLLYNAFDKQALNNLGVIYFNRKEYKEAIEHFNRAIKAFPGFPDPYANMGAAYHNMGDAKNAITYYEQALGFNPNNRMVNGNLAKLYNTLGESAKSEFYAKRAAQ